jgi:hypothetical protein
MSLLVSAPVAAAEVAITTDGGSDYVIVTRPEPSAAEALAAAELAKYLRQMSGAELPVRAGGEVPARALVVVEAASLQKLTPDVKSDAEADGYEIVTRDNRVYLVGGSGRSTLYAVYRFLDALGCRFLAPQLGHYEGSAEVIPKKPSLGFPGERIRTQPVMEYRKLYVEEGHSHDEASLRQMVEWMPKVGYNVLVVPTNYQGSGRVKWDNWRAALAPELQKRQIVIEVGGHGYQNFINADMPAPEGGGTLFEKHPDWFAQDAKGQRQRGRSWVINTTNPDAVAFMVGNVVRYVQERPEINIFDLWPPDGEKWDMSPEGQAQGSPTDRMVMLTNLVRREVAKIRPDVRIEAIAYSKFTEPPKTVDLDEDVLVDFCPISQSFEFQIRDPESKVNSGYVENLKGWRQKFGGDISLYSYYRKYAWHSLPVLLPHYMQDDLKFYAALPLQGISTYAEPGDWFTYELNHYALAHLAWDPRLDVDALIAKFAEARYGSDPVAIRAYTTLEEVVRTYGGIPHTSRKTAEQLQAPRERVATVLAEVRQAAAEGDPAIQRNLTRLGLMCEYALKDLEILTMVASKAPEAEVRAATMALHAFVTKHQDQGVFLVHGNRLAAFRLLERYGIKDRTPATRSATTAPSRAGP